MEAPGESLVTVGIIRQSADFASPEFDRLEAAVVLNFPHCGQPYANRMSRRSRKTTAPKGAATTHRSGVVPTESGNRPARLNTCWMVLGVCLFLVAITWLVFGQTLRHEFVNYDDDDYVVRNAQVSRGLTLDGIAWSFTHVHSSNWHPLTWISHMLDCQFYGLNPGGHHLSNVLLHAATAILLFLVLRQMTGTLWRSAFVAALFAIHPLRVESVAWVAERKDILSGLFFMLTLGAYVRYARAPWSPLRYGLVILLFAVGLMCKPMLVTVPFVLLLLDYWPLNRFALPGQTGQRPQSLRRLILEKLPLLGLGLASCAITLFAQKDSMAPITRLPLLLRLSNAVVSCTDYLRQMFWPTDLAVLYPWEAARLGSLNTVISIALLAVISVVVFVLRRRRYLVTGWLWYLIMLGPVIGILQVGNQARADRYTYLPQIGLYLLVIWAAVDLCTGWRYRRVLLTSLCSVILVALILSARVQAAYWRDSETLWSHALACTTDNIIAEGNLGKACYDKGKPREAMAYFQNSLRINPRQAPIHSSLGVFFLEMGRIDESLAHLQTAVEIEPNYEDAHFNLGNTYLQMGQAKEALVHYNKALEIDPNDTQALNNMAWILATWPDAPTRDAAKAVELAERADSLTRGASPMISATLAAAYAEAARFAEAVKTGQRALQLATAESNAPRAASIRTQIETYQSGAAFRDRRFASTSRKD
jgi:tetratricopeptide (TPR) repeat protein